MLFSPGYKNLLLKLTIFLEITPRTFPYLHNLVAMLFSVVDTAAPNQNVSRSETNHIFDEIILHHLIKFFHFFHHFSSVRFTFNIDGMRYSY